ncbi:MAG TPA: MFS transporter [Vicinamibacterales bacterium]|nr:MFS transporter [Vicinamibacterales bacterium]
MTRQWLSDRHARAQTVAVSAAFLSLFSIVGVALYGLPFFYDFFVRDLGWSRQQVTSGNALSKLVVGPLFGFLAGMLVDRFGPRRLMLAGIVMAGGALVGLASAASLGVFYFFYLFNALGYVCGGPLPTQVLLSRWFDAARGKAMGIAYLGIGVGGALVPLAAHALTQTFGWRGALRWLGVLMILIALPAALLVREPDSPRDGAREDGNSIRPVLRTPAFYLLALASMASIGAVGGTVQNLKLYLSLDRGLPQGEIAATLSLILAGSLVGRLLMGWLADRWPKKRVMLMIYAIVAASLVPLAFAPSAATLRASALVFGIGLGGDYMIIPLMAAELFGVRVLGRLMGVVLTADGVAEAVTPVVVAAIRDGTGSYAGGFALLIALAAIGAVGVALLPRVPAAAGMKPILSRA